MKRCLDENEIAQYVDYVYLGMGKPDGEVLDHVAGCYECKMEILELCEIMDVFLAGGDVDDNY